MNINLDNIDLETIVESAVVSTLTKSLGKCLPEVVEKMINERQSGFNQSLLKTVVTKAVEVSVKRHIELYVASKEEEIAAQIKKHLEDYVQPEMVANTIAAQLKEIKLTIKPFNLSLGKVKSADDEEDE